MNPLDGSYPILLTDLLTVNFLIWDMNQSKKRLFEIETVNSSVNKTLIVWYAAFSICLYEYDENFAFEENWCTVDAKKIDPEPYWYRLSYKLSIYLSNKFVIIFDHFFLSSLW